jgi:transposase InsO family protein
VGWEVHNIESADRAAELVERIRITTDVDLAGWVLHSDNGSPMKGATMLATLQRLGVVPSFSRPSVSDDNPYSEALFRTLKYCPEYPSTGFATVADARAGSRVRRYSLRAQAQRYRLSRRPSVTAASISDPRPAHASAGVLGDGIQERWASATGLVAMTTVTQPGGGSPHERDHP